MEKKIFCKRYLSEVLFALVALLTLFGAIYCMPYHDYVTTTTVVAVVMIQMIFTKFLKIWYPDKSFRTLYFIYLILFSLTLTVLSLYANNMHLLLGVTLVLMGNALDRYRRDQKVLEFEEKYPFSRDIDLLCETDDGRKIRLPFKKRFLGNPIGIFPFKNEPEYIELKEFSDKESIDSYIKGNSFPDTEFFSRIAEKLEQLNLCLKELEVPIISGYYYVEKPFMKGWGEVIKFQKDKVEIIPLEKHETCKFRMFGRFYGEYKPLN